MPASIPALLAALRLPTETRVEFEPLTGRANGPRLAILRGPESGAARRVVLRPARGSIEAENHAAVSEALTNARFRFAPPVLGFADDDMVEEWAEGISAMEMIPPDESGEAAIDALAALHALPLREGLRWEIEPSGLIPGAELPLYRLGFAAHERAAAREPLAAAREALLGDAFGFVHGDATAGHVLLRQGGATIVGFGSAGFGLQLLDLAAFLLTAGLDAGARRALAMRYAGARSRPPGPLVALVDLAGIWWGIGELLELPRRQILALGDEIATHRLQTAAARIQRGVREPAGDHPAAAAIRAALWPPS